MREKIRTWAYSAKTQASKKGVPLLVARRNPVAAGGLYWLKNTSKFGIVLTLVSVVAFIVLVNAALAWSNHNAEKAIVIAGGVLFCSAFAWAFLKYRRMTFLLILLIGGIYAAYLYHSSPEVREVASDAIKSSVSTYENLQGK